MDDNFYLHPSPIRRVFSVAMMVGLGALLIYIAMKTGEMSAGWKVFMLVVGAGALAVSARSWTATQAHLVLTQQGLELNTGEVLCRIDEVQKVERGAFAFKPSNGFVVVLKSGAGAGSKARAWAPGLYWRLGRRIGIGGVTPAGEGKAMADILASRVANPSSPIA
ncbi:hypothetical protein [Celeribacter sp.]|uniref:hypothetical protein n=1 Tax=Celeribacter sp. TaxID=1890673 RepID=UPI003A93FCDD